MMKISLKTRRVVGYVIFGFLFVLSSNQRLLGQEADSIKETRYQIEYGSKGFVFKTSDDRYMLRIQSRFQFRYATPDDQDPVTLADFSEEQGQLFKINRARLKVGGNAFKPWLKYYWEYEISQSNLLDFRLMIEKWSWLNFKIGQWKVEYTRERRISSGEQQLVDRSIINRPFTVDRQQGVELYGDLKGNGLVDFSYWVAALTGTGRGSRVNDDNHLMYFGRLQWQCFGRPFKFEGSDVELSEQPTGAISISAVTNRSPYTRFSSSGGGELHGYEEGAEGQYRVNQVNFETAFKYNGFSWQSEWHRKEIIDKLNDNETTHLHGYYVQMGYLWHQSLSWWPKPLEMAARFSEYRPDKITYKGKLHEASLAFNWFFHKHKNKLSAEITRFDTNVEVEQRSSEWRFRLQWDISM